MTDWRPARVLAVAEASPSARVLRLDVPGWPGSAAGQHIDVRLTAEDGYQAVRSYSLASYGSASALEIAVDEIPDGEVSPYLVRDVLPGDELEVKGPLGGYFVWHSADAGPVQLIAGGSGIVPLVAIARAARHAGAAASARLLYSVRSPTDAIYREELARSANDGGVPVTWAYTRAAPAGWPGRLGRVDDESLRAAVWPATEQPVVYVCGPTGFVEHVADALVRLGHDPQRVRTERFGGS
ncbi:FAD-binding oxidoreductase [Microbacterium sp. ASV49]